MTGKIYHLTEEEGREIAELRLRVAKLKRAEAELRNQRQSYEAAMMKIAVTAYVRTKNLVSASTPKRILGSNNNLS